MEKQNEKSSLLFSQTKQKVLDEIIGHNGYSVPYDTIKVLIMTNYTSPHWGHSTYQIKHDIERAYTVSQNDGKNYYCANNWVKCAIWDLNMYDRGGQYNYYDIKDSQENNITTQETILDNSVNWYIKVHTSKETYITKYLRG